MLILLSPFFYFSKIIKCDCFAFICFEVISPPLHHQPTLIQNAQKHEYMPHVNCYPLNCSTIVLLRYHSITQTHQSTTRHHPKSMPADLGFHVKPYRTQCSVYCVFTHNLSCVIITRKSIFLSTLICFNWSNKIIACRLSGTICSSLIFMPRYE